MDSCALRLLPVRQHAERNLRAVGRLHIEIVQRGGVGLEVGPDLHHDVVLVELGEDGGDLALAEGVVERVVDVGHGDAQPRRGVAVDDQLSRPGPDPAGRWPRRSPRFPCSARSTILRV